MKMIPKLVYIILHKEFMYSTGTTHRLLESPAKYIDFRFPHPDLVHVCVVLSFNGWQSAVFVYFKPPLLSLR